jgi:hypothetical protein
VGFVCSVCGEHHAGRLLDIRVSLPDVIHALSEEERERRTWLADDFAVLDDDLFFVRGLLELPIPTLESRFAYGVWIQVAQRDFTFLMEHWDDPAQLRFAPTDGTLANELGPYVATAGLPARLQPISPDLLPLVEVLAADHPLALDQRRGISESRSDELAARVLHPEVM